MPANTIPAVEQRDHLINVVYGHDPQPPRCDNPQHGSPKDHIRTCPTCAAWSRWRNRMHKRFWERGLKFRLDDRGFHDPQPPPCPRQHSLTAANIGRCQACRTVKQWRDREYRRQDKASKARRVTDPASVLDHIDWLLDDGMLLSDIARQAHISPTAVARLVKNRCTGRRPPVRARRRARTSVDGARHRRILARCTRCSQMIPVAADRFARHLNSAALYITPDVAARILGVAPPARKHRIVPTQNGVRLRLVDAAGTRRRVRAACRNAHPIHQQATRLGWTVGQVRDWLRSDRVHADAADAVADLYPELIATPGTSARTAAAAARKGWPAARYYSESNIDDPTYDPFAIDDDPFGVYRRLRALARLAQGPHQIADHIGESAEQVAVWMEGGPAPAYALHMVEAAYDTLSGRLGPDTELAARAHRLGWPSWVAWDGVDIDDKRSMPRLGLPPGERSVYHPLYSQVWMALLGLATAGDLLQVERIRVVQILHRRGWSDRQIAAWLWWNPDGDLDKGGAAVFKFRLREGISGAGPAAGCDVHHAIVFPPGKHPLARVGNGATQG